MRDGLTEIADYAGSLAGVENIRIDCGVVPIMDKTNNPALDENGKQKMTPGDTEVFVKTNYLRIIGKFHKKWDGITNTLGIADVKLLRWMLTADFLGGEGSSAKLIEADNGEAREIEFKGPNGDTSYYKLMYRSSISSEIPRFGVPGKAMDVKAEFTPTQESIDKFLSCAAAFAGTSGGKAVMFKKEGTDLLVNYGGSTGHSRLETLFATDAGEGDLISEFKWDVGSLTSVLKLVKNKIEAKFTLRDNGKAPADGGRALMDITLDSGQAEWTYLTTPRNIMADRIGSVG